MELDPHFEPQQRARSNTWPLPRPDLQAAAEELNGHEAKPSPDADPDTGPNAAPKRNSSRRNAWGNMSYADLITQAIQSTPENRLTLSQIYEWMVHNVPYFKDKGDTNSSAGWKNSIRHNLSLHNRFMRVQNEGTGKSSWWMINPDAKPGKAARRRAASMETSKYEKKRGRVKKKVEALRAGLTLTPSPSSSVSESLDVLPESPRLVQQQQQHFQLSPVDFRPRASSNASSIGGRLSPIPAVHPESELQETQWSPDFSTALYNSGTIESFSADQLIENITGSMKIDEPAFISSTTLPPANGFGLGLPPVYTTTSPNNTFSTNQQTSYCLTDLQSLSPASLGSPSLPAAQMMNQLMGALNNNGPILPHDLDLNLDALQGDFDCNVDEVIKHELSLDGSLDFNFPVAVQQQLQQQQPQQLHQLHQQTLVGSNDFLINSTAPAYLSNPNSPAICRSWDP